jgi:hypothetical protein
VVRSFPRTAKSPARFRLLAACTALVLAGVTTGAPLAHAEDKLKKRQKAAHGQVRAAQSDLED